jgi:nucleoid-associated protein YgaU
LQSVTTSQRKKMPLLVLLAVAAVSAALFAKKAPLPADPVAPRDDNRQTLARRLAPPAPGTQHFLSSHDDSGLQVPVAATGAADPGAGMEFPASYGRSFSPASALFGPSGEWAGGDERAPSGAGPDLDMPDTAPRRHVVVDGDTLSKLAVRYLGNSDRVAELFRANRALLSNPDLLPIGAVLEIPPAQPATGARPPAAEAPAAPVESDRQTWSDPSSSAPVPALMPVPKGLLGGRDD